MTEPSVSVNVARAIQRAAEEAFPETVAVGRVARRPDVAAALAPVTLAGEGDAASDRWELERTISIGEILHDGMVAVAARSVSVVMSKYGDDLATSALKGDAPSGTKGWANHPDAVEVAKTNLVAGLESASLREAVNAVGDLLVKTVELGADGRPKFDPNTFLMLPRRVVSSWMIRPGVGCASLLATVVKLISERAGDSGPRIDVRTSADVGRRAVLIERGSIRMVASDLRCVALWVRPSGAVTVAYAGRIGGVTLGRIGAVRYFEDV